MTVVVNLNTPPTPHYNVGNMHDLPPENASVENTNIQHCNGGAGDCDFFCLKIYTILLSMTVDLI